MNEVNELKATITDLQNRLREETRQRMECERKAHLLEKLAYRDPATGLRTASYLQSRVREEIERSIRYPAATSLVTICAPADKDESVPTLGQRLADELRTTDQVFSLQNHGLAILLVETPEDGARRVLDRLAQDLEHFVGGYGCTVTTFPVDANLAEDFLNLAMERHTGIERQVHGTNGDASSMPPPTRH